MEGHYSARESEDKLVSDDEPNGKKISEYEKQRLSRIAENNARLEALGISKAAKALSNSSPGSIKHIGKRKKSGEEEEEDDDYRPGEAADCDSESDDQEFLGNASRNRKLKNKTVASKRKVLPKKNLNTTYSFGEYDNDSSDDDDLKKAIALSLQEPVVAGVSTTPSKKTKKPGLMSKMQMTEDELVIYFYQFDESGKGFITLRDLVKMANVHDFTWTEEELQDMIRCFDIDKDRKLSLDEFKKIVTRCRMLKES